MASVRVAGFVPSRNGFHFPNSFARGPVLRVRLGPARLGIGDAANGLCGGMAYATRDLFESGGEPPADRGAPPGGSPLFAFLVRRLFASFDLPAGPLRYVGWMLLPDRDVLGIAGVRGRTARREWPKVKADLDASRLSPLGLVRVRSWNPLKVGYNHQVLAYGYDLDASTGRVSLRVYDPNHPDDDDVAIAFETRTTAKPLEYVSGESVVRGFFHTRYRPATQTFPGSSGMVGR